MQGLNFRKKRKNERKSGRRKGKKPELHFEKEKKRTKFPGGRPGKNWMKPGEIFWWMVEILIVCMVAVLIVAAFGQKVSASGDSMVPVIRNGDVVLVNHFIYKVKDPDRGDIVVYRLNENDGYGIKRVAGLPGETVQIVDGKILIDGNEITEEIYASDISDGGVAQEPVKLGENEYFLIGDNHTASDDSRNPEIGNINKDDIYGTPWLIVSPPNRFGPAG